MTKTKMVCKDRTTETPAHNSRFAKAGVSCFFDSEVLNPSFVFLMKFSDGNPRLRQAPNRYSQCIDIADDDF